jgi:hypothetical protein
VVPAVDWQRVGDCRFRESVLAAGGAPCSSAGDARAFAWTDDSDVAVLHQVNARSVSSITPGAMTWSGSARQTSRRAAKLSDALRVVLDHSDQPSRVSGDHRRSGPSVRTCRQHSRTWPVGGPFPSRDRVGSPRSLARSWYLRARSPCGRTLPVICLRRFTDRLIHHLPRGTAWGAVDVTRH